MRHATPSATTNIRPSEAGRLLERAGKILRAFGEVRAADRLTADEVLIFLALGHLGQSATSRGVVIRPVPCVDIADVLNIPKETVRRKVAVLVERGLVASTTRGALVHDPEKWRLVAESVANLNAL